MYLNVAKWVDFKKVSRLFNMYGGDRCQPDLLWSIYNTYKYAVYLKLMECAMPIILQFKSKMNKQAKDGARRCVRKLLFFIEIEVV